MQTEASADQEAIERFSRRSLAAALVITILLGLFALSTLAGANMPRLSIALLPIAIALAVAALGRTRGIDKIRRAAQEDELRQQSLALAQRDALVVVLVAQPLCAYATVMLPLASPAALMACATGTIGAIVLLASLLWRDR